MTLRISGKHMDMGDAFRTRIEDRISEALEKYFDGGFSGHVTVDKSGSGFESDIMIHLDTGMVLQARSTGQEPQASFDTAADKIEKRLRRYKRKLKSHRDNNQDGAFDAAYRIMSAVPEEQEEVAEDYAPAIVAESSMSLRVMSVANAVVELDTKDSPVFVFRNASSDHVNVVYRRDDGNIGWIDPAGVTTAN
ncbi:ribosome hibernation-promoting factor, HPF/YfiA family [Notoacmeibacter ruber]|uniref:Ribosome hibernation promoting factor n=1 Tax=Notoacmeibacter ruber TaxID=2670375 RepID=A0A3L7J958_9HYPH|nr:ribosome-associated translation inhibitor RaiA [Notoacmeibacter ruber]RLQ86905.1 ribosome-associated translation inhibitor RaiA [Notoacmeibacter ruber]